MSILIKGMEMPEEQKMTITIFPDGRVYKHKGNLLRGYGEDCIPWKAIPVPPHGRLIDADALYDQQDKLAKCSTGYVKDRTYEMMVILHIAPTIIPAEEGE